MNIFIYGQIGREVKASEVVKSIAETTEAIEVYINSPGGNVYEGMAIFNAIGRHGNTSTFIDGLAYSAASWIALAAPKEKRFMAKNAQFGIHQAMNFGGGNKDDLQAQIEVLARIDKAQIELYQNATGLKQSEIQALMKRDTPLDFTEALSNGFVSGEHVPEKIAALFSTTNIDMNDVLKTFATFLKGGEDVPETIAEEVQKETKEAMEKAESTKEQMFAQFAKADDFLAHKKGVETFVDAVMKWMGDQPSKEDIEKWIDAKANEKLLAFMSDVKSRGSVPAPEETQFAEAAAKVESFEPLTIKNKNFFDLKNQ